MEIERRASVVSDMGSQLAHSARACPMRSLCMAMRIALTIASLTLSSTANSGARHTHWCTGWLPRYAATMPNKMT